MRFHNPLPNRSISIRSEADSASLPPLDHTRAITGLSSAQPVKNSGYIAPPIKIHQQQQQDKKDPNKNMTQTQLDSAKRLTQGLSVSLNSNIQSGSGSGVYQLNGTVVRQPKVLGTVPAVVLLDQDMYGEASSSVLSINQNQTQTSITNISLQMQYSPPQSQSHSLSQSQLQSQLLSQSQSQLLSYAQVQSSCNQQIHSYMAAQAQTQAQAQAQSHQYIADYAWPRRPNRFVDENRAGRLRGEPTKATVPVTYVSAAGMDYS